MILDRAVRGAPTQELRRRARAHKDKKAAAIYKLASYGRSTEIFLWLCGGLSAAGLILLATDSSWWLGLMAILAVSWLMWLSRLRPFSSSWSLNTAGLLAPLFSAVIAMLQPFLSRTGRDRVQPTGLYEKEDLLEFLKKQARQTDNRISPEDLQTTRDALSFSDKHVGEVMTPRTKIAWAVAKDPIGPMIMDELHKSGQNRFAVVKEATKAANPEIVGVLYLDDLLRHLEDKGHLRDLMKPGFTYVNEAQSLDQALDGFFHSGQMLLVVVNDFEEIVGVLTIEHLLEQIFPKKSVEPEQSDGQPPDTDVK